MPGTLLPLGFVCGFFKVFCFLSFTWVLQIKDSIISHGCFLKEGIIEHSIVGERSRLDSGVELKVRMSYSHISISSMESQVFNSKELN